MNKKLPPPVSRGDRDKARMARWLNTELDTILERIVNETKWTPREAWKWFHWRGRAGPEKVAARHGNIEPLRKTFPLLARWLHLEPRGKGDRFPRDKWDDAMSKNYNRKLTAAVWDAGRIRKIWKIYYETKPKGYSSPEEIAAHRWEVKVNDVHQWKLSRRCPKDPLPKILA